jgi:tetratricopeptide (TPR) repeat protein
VLAEQHDPRRVAPLLGNLAVAYASVGRYSEAMDGAREAIAAAERSAERFFERWARLVFGRALCSLGDWHGAVAEIESVKDHVPPFYIGMAIAPLVVIALARGQDERVRELVAEHDRRCSGDSSSVFETDFRVLRSAALMIVGGEAVPDLANLITDAQTADYAEWTGWLAPIVDRLVTEPSFAQPLEDALAAHRGPGEMKRTPPVRGRAYRIEANLAARAGEHARAIECWTGAQELTSGCGMAFETAVLALERAEQQRSVRP